MRAIHIDNSSQGTSVTSRTLVAGTSAYNNGLGPGKEGLDFEGTTFEEFNHRAVSYDANSTMFLVTLAERELSSRNERGQIIACRSLATAHQIARETPSVRVFLILVSGGIALTGIDVVAGLLNGISGAVDERGLIMNQVLSLMMNHQFSNRRFKSMLLIGELGSESRSGKEYGE